MYPNVASRANSVSPTGTRSPDTRAQWMSPAVSRPASRNAGASSTPSYPRPVVAFCTACSARTSAITCPRRVESLRLISCTRPGQASPGEASPDAAASSPRATRSLSRTASASSSDRVLVSTKHVPAAPWNAAP